MKFLVLAVSMAFIANVAGAEIFKWVDEKGVVHFSDKPVASQKADVYVPAGTTSSWNSPATGDTVGVSAASSTVNQSQPTTQQRVPQGTNPHESRTTEYLSEKDKAELFKEEMKQAEEAYHIRYKVDPEFRKQVKQGREGNRR